MGDPSKPVTRTAEYSCKTRMPYLEEWTVARNVSVSAVPNEKEDATRTRLEKAARDLAKTIYGCYDVKFVRIQKKPEELAKEPKVQSQIERWTEFLFKNGFEKYLGN